MAVDQQFIINRQGKNYVLYAGLLQEAHSQFDKLFTMSTEVLELDPVPIIRATFSGTDKQGKNVATSGIGTGKRKGDRSGAAADAPIEMAETRAKARALRDATNIGITAFEELGDEPEQSQRSEKQPRKSSTATSVGKGGPKQTAKPRNEPADSPDEDGDATETQKKGVRWLIMQLVADTDGDEEEALEKLEKDVGHPIEAWTVAEARHQIGRLQAALDRKEDG